MIAESDIKYCRRYFKDAELTSVIKLQGGLSHAENYKIRVDNSDYVLRILTPSIPYDERKHEALATVYAAENGIGPSVFYVDDEYHAIIMEFVVGQTLQPLAIDDRDKLGGFLKVVKRLHSSVGSFPEGLTVFKRIRRQLDRLNTLQCPKPSESICRALEKLICFEEIFHKEPLVPCHNDLNALNIIANDQQFRIIDWSDAGQDHPFNDLGFFALVNNLSEKTEELLLELYLNEKPSKKEVEKFRLMKKINLFRIFSTNFPRSKTLIANESDRQERSRELERMVRDKQFFSFSHYINLHMQGLLNSKELVVATTLSALSEFLGDD